MTDIGFIFQTRLGHGTHAGNLNMALEARTDVTPYWRNPEEYQRKVERMPLTTRSWRVHLAVGGYLALRPLARRLRAALIHTQDPAPFCAGMMRRLPTVISLDATHLQLQSFGDHYGGAGSPRVEALKMRLYARTYAAARHLVTFSEWARQSLLTDFHVPPEDATVVPQGIDTDLFRPEPSLRSGGGVARLLFVGGDFIRKGGDLLLRWARERAGGPWELHVAARGAVPETPGVVVHRGVRNNSPELVRLYQQSDLFVLPTRADCSPWVVIEAMACGLPVVSCRVGGVTEMAPDGETGFLTAPDDYGALAERLDALVADAALRRRLGAAGLERARALYGLDNYRALLDLVRGLAR